MSALRTNWSLALTGQLRDSNILDTDFANNSVQYSWPNLPIFSFVPGGVERKLQIVIDNPAEFFLLRILISSMDISATQLSSLCIAPLMVVR